MTDRDFYEPQELPDFTREYEAEISDAPLSRPPFFDVEAEADLLLGERESERSRKKRARRDFFKGFFVTLALLLPLCAGTLIIGYDILDSFTTVEEASQNTERVPISASGSYTLLAAVTEGEEPLGFALLRADAGERRLVFTALPLETILLEGGHPRSASELFHTKGLAGLEAALAETLSLEVDARAALSCELLGALANELGEFRFSLDRAFEVYGAGGIVEYSKHNGSSAFNGNDLSQLVRHAPHERGERTELFERLMGTAWEEYRSADLSSAVAEFYSESVNSLDTNINSAELYRLNRALEAAAALGEGGFLALRLEGSYLEDGGYMLSENCAETLRRGFPRAG